MCVLSHVHMHMHTLYRPLVHLMDVDHGLTAEDHTDCSRTWWTNRLVTISDRKSVDDDTPTACLVCMKQVSEEDVVVRCSLCDCPVTEI